MIIPITIRERACPKLPPQLARLGSDEVVLMELQGSLAAEGARDASLVGRLHLDENKPTLRIGHHLLEGALAALPKPLAVLRRTDQGGAWDVVAVVTRKLVFSKRPIPIVVAEEEN